MFYPSPTTSIPGKIEKEKEKEVFNIGNMGPLPNAAAVKIKLAYDFDPAAPKFEEEIRWPARGQPIPRMVEPAEFLHFGAGAPASSEVVDEREKTDEKPWHEIS